MAICVYGAGSVGCYVGGRLAAAGSEVVFVGREPLARQIARHGLTLTDWRGAELRVPVPRYETAPDAVAGADLVLVTVKSAATAGAGEQLAARLQPGTVVVSFQNGLHNAELLRDRLPGATVLPGVVGFNVVNRGGGRFHCATDGALEVPRHAALAGFAAAFQRAGLPLVRRDDMAGVQAAKLLLNLNNAVNALSGLPLKEQLSRRAYRRCLALAQREALAVYAAAGLAPVRLTPLPPRWLPALLGMPDAVFARVAGRMLAIDPLARSSMWEDLAAGRTTEVDYLNGEIVALARTHGGRAPVNQRLVALVHDAEAGGRRDWSGDELLAELTTAADLPW
jgi:2-dehydropantoate 2-reductase